MLTSEGEMVNTAFHVGQTEGNCFPLKQYLLLFSKLQVSLISHKCVAVFTRIEATQMQQ